MFVVVTLTLTVADWTRGKAEMTSIAIPDFIKKLIAVMGKKGSVEE